MPSVSSPSTICPMRFSLPAFFLALLPFSALGAQPGENRPNIVIIFADDWGRYAGSYAELDGPGTVNDLLRGRTPNIDRVAREGALFRRAFVSAPSCTPSRSALLSGQHFWRTGRGAILRGAVWDPAIPSYPLLLRDAGYHLGETYKVWSPGQPDDAPYGAGQYQFEASGRRFNTFSQNVTRLVREGVALESAKQELYAEVTGNFEAFLQRRPGGKPFSYWFGPTNVHRTWIRGSGAALWGLNPDDLIGKMPPFLPDVPEVREDLADYFGEVLALDAAVGLLLRRLEELGELDNTLVVISGDHGAPGFPLGKCNLYDFGSAVPLLVRGPGVAAGTVIDDMTSLTDLAPTFLEAAGVTVPDVMTGRSLRPVFAEKKSGRVDPRRDAVFIGRERHVENARDGFLPYPQRAIRTQDHLLIINFEPDRWPIGEPYRVDGDNPPTVEELTTQTRITLPDEDAGPTKAWMVSHRNDPQWKPYFERAYGKRPGLELYDLARDPHQVTNVAGRPVYAAIQTQLERRLRAELLRTGDPRVIDGGRYFETPPLSGPTNEAGAAGGSQPPEELRRGGNSRHQR